MPDISNPQSPQTVISGIIAVAGFVWGVLKVFPTRSTLNREFQLRDDEENTYRKGMDEKFSSVMREVMQYVERTETASNQVRETCESIRNEMRAGFRSTHERIDKHIEKGEPCSTLKPSREETGQ